MLSIRIRNYLYNSKLFTRKFLHFGNDSKIDYPSIISKKEKISIGIKTKICANSRIQNYLSLDNDEIGIYIGNRCFIGYNFTILNASRIIIEDDVLIASNCMITSENHGINPESNLNYIEQELVSKPVRIKSGTWIGQNACILPGVEIGNKCIIGANSVVTKSIPDFCIACGNPARIIKKYNFEKHKWEKIDE